MRDTPMHHLHIIFTEAPGQNDIALLLEVIAGEIRRGSLPENEPGFTWKIVPT